MPSLTLTTSPASTICLSRAEAFWTEMLTALPASVAVIPSPRTLRNSALITSFSSWFFVGLRTPLDLRTDFRARSTRKLKSSSVRVSKLMPLILSVIVIFSMCFTLPFLHLYFSMDFWICQGVFLFFFEISFNLLSWSVYPRKFLGYLSPWHFKYSTVAIICQGVFRHFPDYFTPTIPEWEAPVRRLSFPLDNYSIA